MISEISLRKYNMIEKTPLIRLGNDFFILLFLQRGKRMEN